MAEKFLLSDEWRGKAKAWISRDTQTGLSRSSGEVAGIRLILEALLAL